MKEATPSAQTFAATCPHCKKAFEAELIADEAGRHRGFKCPHCRLFVPAERSAATGRGLAGSKLPATKSTPP